MRLRILLILQLVFWLAPLSSGYDVPPPIEHRYAELYLDDPSHLSRVDSALTRAQRRLADILNDTLRYRPSLHLVSRLDAFHALVGDAFPDWGAAAAIPHLKRIVIKSPDHFAIQRSLPELVAHEYAHLALADRLGIREAPRWLDEGIAMYVSMEWGWSENVAMGKAALFRQFIKLDDISRVNRFNAGKAQVAYAQSYLAVQYFIDQYGVTSLNMLLDDIVRGRPLDSALMRSTGSTMLGFEREFHEHLSARYNIMGLFMDTMWFWAALAFIVVVAGILRFRRRRQIYRKWEEREIFESTDFDYGDKRRPERPDPDEDDEPWRR